MLPEILPTIPENPAFIKGQGWGEGPERGLYGLGLSVSEYDALSHIGSSMIFSEVMLTY